MTIDRRRFLTILSSGAIAVAWQKPWLPSQSLAAPTATWAVRKAGPSDASALSSIFNSQLLRRECAYSERIIPWNPETAAQFLTTYTGTLVVTYRAAPVGFVGFINYRDSRTKSSIGPDEDPEVRVLAVDADTLSELQRAQAAKVLVAEMGRKMYSMGFRGCRALINAEVGLPDLFSGHMTVLRTFRHGGRDRARDVRFDAGALAQLAGEGF